MDIKNGNLVAGHISVGVELHIGWYTMAGDEAREGTDVAEDSLVVHLQHYFQ